MSAAAKSVVDSLANVAIEVATRSATEYLRRKKKSADADVLFAALRKHVAAAMPAALEDAKAAIECRMMQIAEQTFKVSMVVAGVAAAKEVAGE